MITLVEERNGRGVGVGVDNTDDGGGCGGVVVGDDHNQFNDDDGVVDVDDGDATAADDNHC